MNRWIHLHLISLSAVDEGLCSSHPKCQTESPRCDSKAYHTKHSTAASHVDLRIKESIDGLKMTFENRQSLISKELIRESGPKRFHRPGELHDGNAVLSSRKHRHVLFESSRYPTAQAQSGQGYTVKGAWCPATSRTIERCGLAYKMERDAVFGDFDCICMP